MLNIIIKICVNIRNIFKNRATIRTCLSLFTSVVFSLLFSFTPNANMIVTITFSAVTLLLGLLFAAHQRFQWKFQLWKLIEKSSWTACLCVFILLFAFAPMAVRSIENNGFDMQYIFDNALANTFGACIVISIILHQRKFVRQNDFKTQHNSQSDWLEFYIICFFGGTLLIVHNYCSNPSSLFEVVNGCYLVCVIFLGMSTLTLFLSHIVGENDLFERNDKKSEEHNSSNEDSSEDNKASIIYPIGTLIWSFLFLLSHALPIFLHYKEAGESVLLLTNCISIVGVAIGGYCIIKKYIVYCLEEDNRKFNCPIPVLIFFTVIPAFISIACLFVNYNEESNIENQIAIGITTIFIVIVIFWYLSYLQNKNKIHKFIGKKELLDFIDEKLTADAENNKYIDSINCCLKNSCRNQLEMEQLLKLYLLMNLFNLNEVRLLNEIKYNSAYREFCGFSKVDDGKENYGDIKNNLHNFIKTYDGTDESKQLLFDIKKFMNNKKAVYVVSIEYIDKK